MNANTQVMRAAEGVRFCSQFDEAAFFEWLAKLDNWITVSGRADVLYLEIKARRLTAST